MLLVMFMSVCVVSCGDDDEDGGSSPTSGTWYLVQWDENPCTTGEYIRFSNGKCNWNNRLGGRNVSYTVKSSSNTSFTLTNASDGSRDMSFSITANTGNQMVTFSSDDIIRVWRR